MSRLPACLVALAPLTASAHSFGTPYVPPIPLWMYVYGGAATLIVTFVVIGFFVTGQKTEAPRTGKSARFYRLSRFLVALLRLVAVAALILTIVSGLIGTQEAAHHVSMILFWVIFLLAFAYLTLFIGHVYLLVNPWQSLVAALERTGLTLPYKKGARPFDLAPVFRM